MILYQFLTAHHELDIEKWKENKINEQTFEEKNLNNTKMIELLPWLVEMSGLMLEHCKEY